MKSMCTFRPKASVPYAVILSVLVLATTSLAAADLDAEIGAIAQGVLDAGKTPGLSIAVARGGEIIHAAGYGFADLENGIRSDAETNYRVGSITKSFTALSIMQLVEKGKVKLSDPVTKYIPGYNTHGHIITVQQLINHTCGIPNYTDIEKSDRTIWRQHRSHDEMRAVFEPAELLFEPGAGWYYTNSGYYLLGMIIEKVSGMKYDEYLDTHVVGPAGLENTQFGWQRPLIDNRAQGYERTEDGWVNATPISMTTPFSAGALRSTVLDLVRWMRSITDGTLIKPATFETMATVVPLDGGRGAHGYANGLYIGELGGHRKITHMGDIDGFAAQLAYYPDDDLFVAVTTNHQGAGPDAIERQVARAVLELPQPEPKDVPLTPQEIASWSGSYYVGPMGIHLTEKDGALHFSLDKWLPHPMKLLYQGDGELWLAADPDNRVYLDPTKSPADEVRLLFSSMIMTAVRSE